MRTKVASILGVALLVAAAGSAVASPMNSKKMDHRAWGTVTKVDAQTMTFTITTPKTKKMAEFAVNSSTRIRESGKTATFAALKDGDHVRVGYVVENGKDVASWVNVKPVKMAKAMKSKKKW